jgi:hypothetical protein
MDAICTLCPVSQKQVIQNQVHTPPPAKVPVEAGLGENTLQPLVPGQRPWIGQEEGCGDHCELFSSSLGGQTAELVTSAG